MHLRPRLSYGILAVAMVLLAIRYFLVLVEGYDTFEGLNDPEADWLNYVAYTSLAFVVARHMNVLWSVLASIFLSIAAEGVRQLLITEAWANMITWPEISPAFLSEYPNYAFVEFIIALLVGCVTGVFGGLLGKKSWVNRKNKPDLSKNEGLAERL